MPLGLYLLFLLGLATAIPTVPLGLGLLLLGSPAGLLVLAVGLSPWMLWAMLARYRR